MIYCLLGASGSGKSTIAEVFKEFRVEECKSHTTRRKRVGETGDEYYFTSPNDFNKIDFIEKVTYSGNQYGLSVGEVSKNVTKGDCFVIVDRKGVEQLKKLYDNVVVIYVYAPVKDLKERMKSRGDGKDKVQERLNYAVENGELENFDIADYVIYNNKDLESAKNKLRSVLTPTVYIDIDNTIINSTKRFVDIYNKINKSNYDWTKVKEWGFQPELNVSNCEIKHIFDTEYFYKEEYLYDRCKLTIKMIREQLNCNVVFLTIGTKTNNKHKAEMIGRVFEDVDLICINKENVTMDKSMIKMKHNDIIIDDNEDNLITSNCINERRILFCPEGQKGWNSNFRGLKTDSWVEVRLIVGNLVRGEW